TGFPFKDLPLLRRYLDQFAAVMGAASGIRRAGSAALDLADVAAGRLDAFWELTLAPWDVAAGVVLIRGAGGIVPTLAGLEDVQADPSHNRSVFTLVARPDAAAEAAFRGMRVATERIDLTQHTGEHPRMGATDVVPFVPVRDVTMDDCVALARRLAERAATELAIPIYLYARAATRPDRERLPDIRKGEFEDLRDRIGKDPAADPDFGPRHVH